MTIRDDGRILRRSTDETKRGKGKLKIDAALFSPSTGMTLFRQLPTLSALGAALSAFAGTGVQPTNVAAHSLAAREVELVFLRAALSR